ncbi:EAL domain-containing protein [Aquimonas sp.]|uniref:EAL domain-containing protein n=1 Tax=Aquimonas sp. TaxID=1872588 RepID=UPI0037C12B57
MVGAEALIRWQHPSRGLLGPAEFIELAEETALIIPIGSWMLQSVCCQQSAWIVAGLPVVPVAVNVSAVQFEKGDLLQVIRAALLDSGLPPRMLHIELTESAVMREPTAAAVTLHAIRALSVELSLDDFGTGYSSLAHLKRYPFSTVKIDRSFVTHITSNIEDAAIATAIIAMSHQLGLRVVAEGVETQGQFNYLSARCCDEMQGYLFSRAVAANDYEHLLRAGTRLPLPEGGDVSLSTLLVVDNKPDICTALTAVLSRDGYRILSAASAEQALDLLAVNSVQVILANQRMSAMTGTELLGKIASLYPAVVRILMSAHTELSVLTAAVNQGAVFKLIAKPWDEDQLRQQVREVFEHQRASSHL